ncbi:50S ribosomal protein L18 [Acetobacterium wieringae]|jgi:large subunit ribosomal protein L18|uniref:Large ribosomal subunit protein uL18 n=1 Tax=Acetobacterium wieringae TaxID=52694 RepID=A0A1F2PM62_9FIRM|nr:MULTISPECIES: 50S ribosomal protein L18 [Acetobacterium]HAZ05332.1 50S ribosomal protein L18 [Acetobacterium sp.]MEA4806621.1 50S ribosomal protein L18 [Acetobacterium wieringae]OFV71832.1 50S ribosomal protein L18 [Acetobacterium wieringae]OXS24735.1 MAG: 50S ribosomal protein L18 [Acetobacterium sp. MES1]TYC85658.1 50S ribosomal protein L18 [Acetobacterium wieringae]
MIKKPIKNKIRIARHYRVRNKVSGTEMRPRLNVFRSNKNIYAQIIDDTKGITLVSASSNDSELKGQLSKGGDKAAAKAVGQAIAKRALEKGIEAVVFDRGGYVYHGRVKELADGAREAGLKF